MSYEVVEHWMEEGEEVRVCRFHELASDARYYADRAMDAGAEFVEVFHTFYREDTNMHVRNRIDRVPKGWSYINA